MDTAQRAQYPAIEAIVEGDVGYAETLCIAHDFTP